MLPLARFKKVNDHVPAVDREPEVRAPGRPLHHGGQLRLLRPELALDELLHLHPAGAEVPRRDAGADDHVLGVAELVREPDDAQVTDGHLVEKRDRLVEVYRVLEQTEVLLWARVGPHARGVALVTECARQVH